MTAIYNENDPGAANVLRELIANNLIAPGDVDERSIKDVRADDYRGYDQWHFFAGAGMWSGALRRSGWSDAKPVITGSCPCQPFSGAGKGLGFDDPRHLWPDWLRIIDEAREQGFPGADVLFGEQVDKANLWVDLVQSDLETRGFAFASPDLPAAGFAQGAHIRQRFYWVADRHNAERWSDLAGRHIGDWPQAGRIEGYGQSGAGLATGGMADGSLQRQRQEHAHTGRYAERDRAQGITTGPDSSRENGRLGITQGQQYDGCGDARGGRGQPSDASHVGRLGDDDDARPPVGPLTIDERGAVRVEGPTIGASGSLLGCDWLFCHDGKIRPVESGAFPLAATSPGRLGALRIYGNGLDLETAVNFISAYMEACEIAAVMSEFT